MQIYFGSLLAFIISFIIYGFPSYSKYEHLGKDLVWRSYWFWSSVVIHGCLGIVAYLLLDALEINLEINGKSRSIAQEPYVFACIAGLFSPSIISLVISFVSIPGKKLKYNKLREFSDFYDGFLYNRISNEVDNIIKNIIENPLDESLNRLNIEELQDRFALRFDAEPEDIGWVKDEINKINSIQITSNVDSYKKRRIFSRLLSGYLVRFGVKKFHRDIQEIIA